MHLKKSCVLIGYEGYDNVKLKSASCDFLVSDKFINNKNLILNRTA